MVQFRRGGRGRQEGATRLCLHVRQRRLGDDSRLPREVDARGDGRGAGRARAGEGGARDEGPRRFVRSKGSVAFEGGSGAQGAEGLFCRAGARQSGGRREDLGTAGGGRSDEAVGASQGRRHSQQHPFQSLLPFPVAGEGHHCSNRSRSSAVAPAEVLPDMSYYISDTISISSDPCATIL